MKRDRNFAGKRVLLGMIAAIIMALCGCSDRAGGEAISLEDLRQKTEVREENANPGSDEFLTVIGKNAPEEILEEGDIQEENVRDKMEQMEEVEPPSVTTKESGGENVSTQVLLDRNDIEQIQIINGSNGEHILLTEGDCFEQILNFYEQLRIAEEGERNQIVGYTYSLTFYDSQSHELQTMVPRSGKVVLDSIVYTEDGSNVGDQLNQYIAEHYTEIRPVCKEIPYPPENLD